MDPKATLFSIEDAITNDESREADRLLSVYADWRDRDGFEPVDIIPRHILVTRTYTGDAFWRVMVAYFILTFETRPERDTL